MAYDGNPIKMDDLGVPLFLETPKRRLFFQAKIFFSDGQLMYTFGVLRQKRQVTKLSCSVELKVLNQMCAETTCLFLMFMLV